MLILKFSLYKEIHPKLSKTDKNDFILKVKDLKSNCGSLQSYINANFNNFVLELRVKCNILNLLKQREESYSQFNTRKHLNTHFHLLLIKLLIWFASHKHTPEDAHLEPESGSRCVREHRAALAEDRGRKELVVVLPGELGHPLQEPGGVAVQRHGVALEASQRAPGSHCALTLEPDHVEPE